MRGSRINSKGACPTQCPDDVDNYLPTLILNTSACTSYGERWAWKPRAVNINAARRYLWQAPSSNVPVVDGRALWEVRPEESLRDRVHITSLEMHVIHVQVAKSPERTFHARAVCPHRQRTSDWQRPWNSNLRSWALACPLLGPPGRLFIVTRTIHGTGRVRVSGLRACAARCG